MPVGRIGVEQIEQPIDQRHEPEAELLVGQIPLAIPVRVRNDVDVEHAEPMSRKARTSACQRGLKARRRQHPESAPSTASTPTTRHPLTAPAVRPATKNRCRKTKAARTGTSAMKLAAASSCQSVS